MAVAIILTNSRGGLLAMIFMICGLMISYSRNKARSVVIALAVAGLVLVAAPERMKNFDSKEESANSRFRFWQEGFTQLRLHPLTGVGYRKFPDVNGGFVAHNSYVHCFAELGLPGYFFWVACIYFAFKRSTGLAGDVKDESSAEKFSHFMSDSSVLVQQSAQSRANTGKLLAARLALSGYLAACFWISRTYTPILFMLVSLPIAQQISVSNRFQFEMQTPSVTIRDGGRVICLCIASMAMIWLVIWKNI
jgi:hypothetical protein